MVKKTLHRNLHIKVLWCGADIGTFSKKLNRCGTVKVGQSLMAHIRSPVWPLWDDMEILTKEAGGLLLNPDLPWSGVISSGGQVHVLNEQKRSRKYIEIRNDTVASLRVRDITVAIRVGGDFLTSKVKTSRASAYRGGMLQFIADRPTEWATLFLGLAASGIIYLASTLALKGREPDHYNSVAELPSAQLVRFVSPKNLETAPHVIQEGMDRVKYVHSVYNYYQQFAQVVGMGLGSKDHNKIFSTTREEYSVLRQRQHDLLEGAEERQKNLVTSDKGGSLITIPMVLGESLEGSMQRVLDKVSFVQLHAEELANERVRVAKEFEEDTGYKFDASKADRATAAQFAKITQGYLGTEADEVAQKTQARQFSLQAAESQLDLWGPSYLRSGVIQCCEKPVGGPMSSDQVAWLAPEFDANSNTRIASLKASTWGAPVRQIAKIREPVAGRIEAAAVDKTVAAGRYQIRLCYELALRRNQALAGAMEWRWQINTLGKPSDISLIQSSLKDEEFIRCVRDKIAAWHFPKPTGGSVEIRYPFEFSRDKG